MGLELQKVSFACAGIGGAVYVAGGHDDEKNTLRLAYLLRGEDV